MDSCSCGPARHSIEVASRGVEDVIAVDENPEMLQFAEQLAADSGVAVRYLKGRLEELFRDEAALPVRKKPFFTPTLPPLTGFQTLLSH